MCAGARNRCIRCGRCKLRAVVGKKIHDFVQLITIDQNLNFTKLLNFDFFVPGHLLKTIHMPHTKHINDVLPSAQYQDNSGRSLQKHDYFNIIFHCFLVTKRQIYVRVKLLFVQGSILFLLCRAKSTHRYAATRDSFRGPAPGTNQPTNLRNTSVSARTYSHLPRCQTEIPCAGTATALGRRCGNIKRALTI